MSEGATIVVDIGKTLSKVSLWSKSGTMLERVTRPNTPQPGPDYTALDTEGTAKWLTQALALFAKHRVEAIITVAHGAAVAAIRDGSLAFPPLDYEHLIPEADQVAYQSQRDSFSVTGSPSLPQGLNIGTQLHFLEGMLGPIFSDAMLLPYAQYWSWLLSGVAASEVTSLGCHSDLWAPAKCDYSPMAKRRGWATLFAPLAKAGDVIGTLRPELAEQTGLSPSVRVHCGIHDSNAALNAARGFPEIMGAEATIVSTGTWFVAMRSPKSAANLSTLPEARDCLVNVDAEALPVPSSRWMGGREIELLAELGDARIDRSEDQSGIVAALPTVIAKGAMILPTLVSGCGPFPSHVSRWINPPTDVDERRAAIALYAALVTDVALNLIGAKTHILVEGRFADAKAFTRALTTLRQQDVIYTASAENDVSFGALRLIDPALRGNGKLSRVEPLDVDLLDYRRHWLTLLKGDRDKGLR